MCVYGSLDLLKVDKIQTHSALSSPLLLRWGEGKGEGGYLNSSCALLNSWFFCATLVGFVVDFHFHCGTIECSTLINATFWEVVEIQHGQCSMAKLVIVAFLSVLKFVCVMSLEIRR